MSRDRVIDELAKLVTQKNAANRVDLKQPELAILIEIIRNICCISVLPDYYRFRRYNLMEIAGVDQTEPVVQGVEGVELVDSHSKDEDVANTPVSSGQEVSTPSQSVT